MAACLICSVVMVCRKAWLPLLLGMGSSVALAQALSDPTQPPAGIYYSVSDGLGSAAAAHAAPSNRLFKPE